MPDGESRAIAPPSSDQSAQRLSEVVHQSKDVVGIVLDPLATDAIGAPMCGEVDSVHTLIVKPPDLRRPGQVVPAGAVDQQHSGRRTLWGSCEV
jgi:hypothetical protein